MPARNRLVAVRIHVGPVAPVVVGLGDLQTDLVFEHMRRRIDLDVHGSPQGDPQRGAVRRHGQLVGYDLSPSGHFPGACSVHSRPSGSRTIISVVP
jgi:hypothetical protein